MRSPLTHGLIYIGLGLVFTYLAVDSVNRGGWGFFAYIFVLFATYDIGSGIRLVMLHLKIKKKMNEKK